MTKVEWAQRPGTIGVSCNAWAGCSKDSPGCMNCYAERMAARLAAMAQRECAWCGERISWNYETGQGSAVPCDGQIYGSNDRGYVGDCLAMLCPSCKEMHGFCPHCSHNEHLATAKHAYLYVVHGLDNRKPTAQWNGLIKLNPKVLEVIPRWRKPRTCFMGSMTDLFHPGVPDKFIREVWTNMMRHSGHTFIVSTKRASRMREWTDEFYGHAKAWEHAPSNIWGLVSVENQKQAWRVDELVNSLFAIRGVSCEPLLGPVDLSEWLWHMDAEWPMGGGYPEQKIVPSADIHWVIAGGESGPEARPMYPGWAKELRDQCIKAIVKFFFKQWGRWCPYDDDLHHDWLARRHVGIHQEIARSRNFVKHIGPDPAFEQDVFHPDAVTMVAVGKKQAGYLLEGQEHREWPA